jgi:nanoRNase/pAp phosphatase (c-di-AMP/oligoRNAs hydrolase)
MKIIHHIDNDGNCAGAIIALTQTISRHDLKTSDFIPYDNNGEIKLNIDDVIENEKIYIVDISLTEQVYMFIKRLITEKGCTVVHIDHHQTSLDFVDSMVNDECLYGVNELSLFESKYIRMFDIKYSGALLCWIYSCMNPDEQLNPSEVKYDVSDNFRNFYIETIEREYAVPNIVRMIDDNDVYRNISTDAKLFALGFMLEKNKHPSNRDLWESLLFNSVDVKLHEYVCNGTIIDRFKEMENINRLKYSFEREIDGLKFLCLNEGLGNSRIFGDEFDKYDGVIKFSYDGEVWKYTAYGSKVHDVDNKVNLLKIAERYGGGGHRYACGWRCDHNIFDKKTDMVKSKKPFLFGLFRRNKKKK